MDLNLPEQFQLAFIGGARRFRAAPSGIGKVGV